MEVNARDAAAEVRRNGYVVLGGLLPPGDVQAMRDALERMHARSAIANKSFDEPGTRRGYNLIRRDPVFREAIQNPLVVGVMDELLGADCILSSFNARAALPGQGFQHLHRDGPWAPGMALTCNSLWLVDDFTAENGATRIVPASHTRPDGPPESSPDEIQIVAPAGTVVIFDATTWHGGAQNRTDTPRRVAHGYFCRSWVKPQLDHTRSYDAEWLDTASPLLKRLMGFNSQVAFEQPEGCFRTATGPAGEPAG